MSGEVEHRGRKQFVRNENYSYLWLRSYFSVALRRKWWIIIADIKAELNKKNGFLDLWQLRLINTDIEQFCLSEEIPVQVKTRFPAYSNLQLFDLNRFWLTTLREEMADLTKSLFGYTNKPILTEQICWITLLDRLQTCSVNLLAHIQARILQDFSQEVVCFSCCPIVT